MAPGPSGSSALRLPSRDPFPSVEERLVTPETREEILRGRKLVAQPALDPHADRRCELDYIKGEAKGKAAAVLGMLAARSIDVNAEVRTRIEACKDMGTLDRWIAQAVSLASADELMNPPSSD